MHTFVNTQLFHGKNCHWSKAQRDMALKHYFISPASYRSMLQDGFVLPSISTIQRWHSMVTFSPGISSHMEILLKAKASGMPDINKKCVLNFDEMSSKSELQYSVKVSVILFTLFAKFAIFNNKLFCNSTVKVSFFN